MIRVWCVVIHERGCDDGRTMAKKPTKLIFNPIGLANDPSTVEERAPGWKQGLCDCFSSKGMCCCVMLFPACAIGQVQSISRGGAGWACLLFTLGLVGLDLARYVAMSVNWTVANVVLMLAAAALATYGVYNARVAYRATRNGGPAECGALGDCLIAGCCGPCAVCQMFAQDDIEFAGSGKSNPYELPCSTYAGGVNPDPPSN